MMSQRSVHIYLGLFNSLFIMWEIRIVVTLWPPPITKILRHLQKRNHFLLTGCLCVQGDGKDFDVSAKLSVHLFSLTIFKLSRANLLLHYNCSNEIFMVSSCFCWEWYAMMKYTVVRKWFCQFYITRILTFLVFTIQWFLKKWNSLKILNNTSLRAIFFIG